MLPRPIPNVSEPGYPPFCAPRRARPAVQQASVHYLTQSVMLLI
eukprot:gene29128-36121_t